MVNKQEIVSVVSSIVRKYWIGYPSYILDNYINRHVFQITLLTQSLGDIQGKSVVDVGGGWGAFAASCAALGMNAMIVDDFGDPGKCNVNDPRQSLPKNYNVNVICKNVINDGLDLAPGSVSAITSFDMLEHLHSSPKQFLHDAMNSLQPNGVFLLGVPNSVGLRKRIMVPLGKGNWSHFSDWYDTQVFRGHVREPDLHDLRKIADDISLCDYKIYGRNWLGYDNKIHMLRAATGIADHILRYTPGLCSDLYLLGRK